MGSNLFVVEHALVVQNSAGDHDAVLEARESLQGVHATRRSGRAQGKAGMRGVFEQRSTRKRST